TRASPGGAQASAEATAAARSSRCGASFIVFSSPFLVAAAVIVVAVVLARLRLACPDPWRRLHAGRRGHAGGEPRIDQPGELRGNVLAQQEAIVDHSVERGGDPALI